MAHTVAEWGSERHAGTIDPCIMSPVYQRSPPSIESLVYMPLHLGLFEILLAAVGVVTIFALAVRLFWGRGMRP